MRVSFCNGLAHTNLVEWWRSNELRTFRNWKRCANFRRLTINRLHKVDGLNMENVSHVLKKV